MKLINTTWTHQELVNNQLNNTDAFLVETYSAGNTDVVFITSTETLRTSNLK